MRLNECVFSTLDDFLQVENWRIWRSNTFASNSVSNSEKLLWRLFRCCNRLIERIVWAVRNVTSGTGVLNRDRTSIEDDPKSGRPSTSMDDDHVEKVLVVIRQNRRLTVREVAEEAGICKSSCHLILTDKTEDASYWRKICAASADRCTKTQPRHCQSGAVWSFECWWKPSEKCHNRW